MHFHRRERRGFIHVVRTPTSNEEKTPIPLKLGNFEIETTPDGKPRLLGKGTFGQTFLARHSYLESPAAIKVISEKFLSQSRARERFLDEAKAVARLRHPHIAQVYDFGPVEDGLFYAMEFCAGGNLSEWMKTRGSLSAAQVIGLAQQVASALKCCHAAKFIHRDIKPANIMLASSDGPLIAKLIDFGLVQSEQTAQHEGQAAHYIGTPLYASPEQLKEQDVDARTDLFSLGMTLWHLATGNAPDSGISSEIIASRLGNDSYEPRIPNSLPPPLRAIIARLVEKDRTRRFESASQLLDALNSAATELGASVFTDLQQVEGSSGRDHGKPEAHDTPPLQIETYVGSLGEDFHEPRVIGESITGKTYRAWPKTPGAQPIALHALDRSIAANPELLAKICAAAGKLAVIRPPGMLAVGAIRRYDDEVVIIMEAPPERDLISELLDRGKVTVANARGMFELIAATSDRLIQAGLPGVELGGSQIFVSPSPQAPDTDWQPLLVPRFLFKRDCIGNTLHAEEDAAATLDATTSGSGVPDYEPGQFARLFYRIVAGRKLPEVASKSVAGYVPVPELSEESNRILAQVVAGELAFSTCGELLSRVLSLEGLGAATSLRAGTSTAAARTHATATQTGTAQRLRTATTATASGTSRSASAPSIKTATPLSPISSTASAATAQQKKQSKSPLPAIIGTLALLGAAAGGYWWWSNRPDQTKVVSNPPTVPATPTPAPATPPPADGPKTTTPSPEQLPAGYTLQIVGDDMKSTRFTLGAAPLDATRTKDGWEIKLPATTLPAEITGQAIGYVPTKMLIKYRGDAEKPIQFTPERHKGKLIVRRKSPNSDYQDVGARMTRLLAEEEGHVPVARFYQAFPIDKEETTVLIPSGVYRITLQGNSNLVTERRLAEEVEVKADSTTTLELPPSWVGNYTATAKEAGTSAAGGTIECRFEILPNLASSTFRYTAGSVSNEATMSECRLDKNGDFQARIFWSKAQEGQTFDWKLTAKRESGSLLLTVEEFSGVNRQMEEEKGRKPYSPQEWSLAGHLKPAP